MAPSRKKGARASAAAAARQQWKVGDLVLAKMKGFPAWPATVTEPEKWGYSKDRKKLLVYFYGTKQIAFCNHADLEAFSEEKKKSLLGKRQGKGSDFVRAVEEIIDMYERKQSSAEMNSGDECINSNTVHSESSRSKSFSKSQEDSLHVTNQHQTEALCASARNTDAINSEDTPRASVEGDFYDTSLATEPTEKVSILDQLRQTPFSTTTSTRKRHRDGSQQSYVIHRAPSLRRSRSSSGSDPSKFQKPSILRNCTEQAGAELVFDMLQEDLTLKKRLTGETAQTPICCNGGPLNSANLLSNGSSEEGVVSDIAATRSDAEDGSMSESSCKLEKLNEYLEKDLGMNGSITFSGKFELPIKAVIFKKKRKPNRKRVANTQDCATFAKEEEMQAELRENLPDSPNSCKRIVENFSKADGDEHLPLVKRARVRMGKPAEHNQLDVFVRDRESLELEAPLEGSDKFPKSSGPVRMSSADRTSLDKEVSSSSPVNDTGDAAGRDLMSWNTNKYQLKGIALDVEAALPPSKRLHRALEAMSANAAEATHATPKEPNDMEMISIDCTVSPKTDALHAVNENVGSAKRSHCIQSSDNTAFQSITSSVASQNLEVPILTSSEEKLDDSVTHDLMRSVNMDCKEASEDVNVPDAPFTFTVAYTNIPEHVLKPCSSKSVEKQTTSTNIRSVLDQFMSPSADENGNEKSLPCQKCCDPGEAAARESLNEEANVQKPDPALNAKEGSDCLPSNVTGAIPPVAVIGLATSNTSGTIKSPLSDEDLQARSLPDVAKVLSRVTPKDWGTSDLTPMKDLIAAAQAKRLLSRSTSFPDYAVDGKIFVDDVVSPSAVSREDSSLQGSPHNPVVYHRPATDDRSHHLQSGARSPFVNKKEKGCNKLTATVESNIARRSFETLLCTLSRTKESIGRATRAAMDCAKFGVAGEVVEILIQHLERESSLYKRIDLFFLVDSITQYSRSQKGGYGDAYLSLVQSVLPRLLSAAAPHGNAAWENRRQCLKVLRLWLERKTLSESVLRHHIRELESVNETSLSSYSRRPPRTERALNDPIREMEGMFVDEYGSNTSFQLQNFICPRLLEDDEGSGDDEKSFEAVTPEHNAEFVDEKGTAQTPNDKHRHILEDVDGELEMEDVAPPCEVEANSGCLVARAESVCDPQSQPRAPPLPEDLPPSTPPLPSSPPPMAPPCPASHTAPQQQLPGSHVTDATDFRHTSTNNVQNHQSQSVGQQPNNFQGNLASSESVPYYTHGYGGITKQIPPPPPISPSGPYSSHITIQSGNNFQPKISAPSTNKGYHLQPPPTTVSNQFSYIQAESQQRQSWGSSSFGDRFQYAHDPHGGNYFADRNLNGPVQHENAERGTFSPATSTGHVLSDIAGALPGSHSRYGPPSDPSGNPCNGWSVPPRIPSYSVSASRPSMENPVSRATGGYWRPR